MTVTRMFFRRRAFPASPLFQKSSMSASIPSNKLKPHKSQHPRQKLSHLTFYFVFRCFTFCYVLLSLFFPSGFCLFQCFCLANGLVFGNKALLYMPGLGSVAGPEPLNYTMRTFTDVCRFCCDLEAR